MGGCVDESVGKERCIASLSLQWLIEYAMLLPFTPPLEEPEEVGRALSSIIGIIR